MRKKPKPMNTLHEDVILLLAERLEKNPGASHPQLEEVAARLNVPVERLKSVVELNGYLGFYQTHFVAGGSDALQPFPERLLDEARRIRRRRDDVKHRNRIFIVLAFLSGMAALFAALTFFLKD